MFSLKVPASLHHTKITSTTAANADGDVPDANAALSGILNFQRGFHKRLLLIAFYCCCWYTLIIAVPPAVVAFPTSSLMMFQPQVNSSTVMASSHITGYLSSKPMENAETIATPGQQVINAVPDNGELKKIKIFFLFFHFLCEILC